MQFRDLVRLQQETTTRYEALAHQHALATTELIELIDRNNTILIENQRLMQRGNRLMEVICVKVQPSKRVVIHECLP